MSAVLATQWGNARAVASFRALSMLGSELTVFALILRERGHGATFVSILMAAGTISLVAMIPLAGWISDRFSTKQIIPFTSVLQAALVLSLIYEHNMVLITITIFLSSSCGAIENPAFMALMPTLVKPEDFTKQMGFAQSLYALAGLAAPAFGGILVSQTGYRTPFIVDAITFAVLALAPTLLNVDRKSEAVNGSEKIRAADGLKYIFKSRYLRSLAILLCAFLFAAGTVSIGNLFLLTKILHASVFIFGLSGVASALGMITGGLALMKVTIPDEKQTKAISTILISFAILIVVLSFAGHWAIVLILDFVFGILMAMLTALVSTIFIQRSPNEMRGRIGAALNGFINIGMIGSLLVSGPLLDWVGTRKLLFFAGALAALLVAIFSPATFREPTLKPE